VSRRFQATHPSSKRRRPTSRRSTLGGVFELNKTLRVSTLALLITYWLVGVFRAARLLLAPLRTSLGIVLLVMNYIRNYALANNVAIIYVIMHL